MFVQMMLKSMREALPKDGLFSSDQTRLYTSMYDQQIAQQMTAGKGLGLADMMVKQMTSGQTMPADDAPQVPLKFSPRDGKQLSKSGADPTGAQSHTENAGQQRCAALRRQ